jgi:hypothetical protein
MSIFEDFSFSILMPANFWQRRILFLSLVAKAAAGKKVRNTESKLLIPAYGVG